MSDTQGNEQGPPLTLAASGFREYDMRWRFPEQVDLAGLTRVGHAIAAQMHEEGIAPRIAVGHDFRAYSPDVKSALVAGLLQGGIDVHDIGLSLSPMAYFSQFHLDVPAAAMVTASHNPNGWTGVKLSFERPLTHGPDRMARLKEIALGPAPVGRAAGRVTNEPGVKPAYLADLAGDLRIARPLRVVCATGNGTASAFAPALLRRIGVEVIDLHTTLDHSFPNYNPNPETLEMLADMTRAVHETGADLAVGFDGDGDRCGVIDDKGNEIPADKLGVLMAREFSRRHPGAHFIADIKSTALFLTDPVLRENAATAEFWMTGHSHMKRRVAETGALAGFEKSGHHYLAPPIGRGYDCGLRVAVELCRLLDAHPESALSQIAATLPRTWSSPTMSPYCPDAEKYEVAARLSARLEAMAKAGQTLAGQAITHVNTRNGARVELANGSWGLIRPSSNTPNLVVVCESTSSQEELLAIFKALDALLREEPSVGDYDQRL